mmetsp:Transcript_16801/g.42047  ORF Transcript_16801/g.42047 Transcript_16801/m.42047 type:complete len:506 (-) Transcript_16801:177-1694(-)
MKRWQLMSTQLGICNAATCRLGLWFANPAEHAGSTPAAGPWSSSSVCNISTISGRSSANSSSSNNNISKARVFGPMRHAPWDVPGQHAHTQPKRPSQHLSTPLPDVKAQPSHASTPPDEQRWLQQVPGMQPDTPPASAQQLLRAVQGRDRKWVRAAMAGGVHREVIASTQAGPFRPFVFDTECAWTSRSSQNVLEVCMVDIVSGDRFTTLVSTGKDISDQCMRIHGISQEIVAGAPRSHQAFLALLLWVAQRCRQAAARPLLVAHNTAFHVDVLAAELAALGNLLPVSWHQLCTWRLAKRLLPDQPDAQEEPDRKVSRKLFDLAARFGCGVDTQAHRAEPDTDLTIGMLGAMLRAHYPQTAMSSSNSSSGSSSGEAGQADTAVVPAAASTVLAALQAGVLKEDVLDVSWPREKRLASYAQGAEKWNNEKLAMSLKILVQDSMNVHKELGLAPPKDVLVCSQHFAKYTSGSLIPVVKSLPLEPLLKALEEKASYGSSEEVGQVTQQ